MKFLQWNLEVRDWQWVFQWCISITKTPTFPRGQWLWLCHEVFTFPKSVGCQLVVHYKYLLITHNMLNDCWWFVHAWVCTMYICAAKLIFRSANVCGYVQCTCANVLCFVRSSSVVIPHIDKQCLQRSCLIYPSVSMFSRW